MERKKYQTKQKDKILKIIKRTKKKFTVKDIHNKLNDEVGLTTVYRLIEQLVADGYLNKTIGINNEAFYEYLEKCDNKNHFYLKCEKCGKLLHVDCKCIGNLSKHVLKEHNFKTTTSTIIINGLCEKCSKKVK